LVVSTTSRNMRKPGKVTTKRCEPGVVSERGRGLVLLRTIEPDRRAFRRGLQHQLARRQGRRLGRLGRAQLGRASGSLGLQEGILSFALGSGRGPLPIEEDARTRRENQQPDQGNQRQP
jgi:hypothetical protein